VASDRIPYRFEAFLVSFAVILLEINYTRVFSFKVLSAFTYVIIAIAMLGLGAGGVLVTLLAGRRRLVPDRLVARCCLAGGASVLLGYFAIALIQLNLFGLVGALDRHHFGVALWEGVKLLAACGVLLAPFLAAGLALAAMFATAGAQFSRLYCADLVGAGLACALSVPLMVALSPPGAIMLAGAAITLAAVRPTTAASRRLLVPLGALVACLLLGAILPSRLPDPVADEVKAMAPPPPDRVRHVHFSRWSPILRVDVIGLPDPEGIFLSHDGTLGSAIHQFDGDPRSLGEMATDERVLPFALLRPAPRVAIIGAAGGREILVSLYQQAAHIDAVELNPVTVSLLTTHFAGFSGHLAENPRVSLINAEGRRFLKNGTGGYDLVWFVAPDTYAAMNAATAGGFVLAESYLYTVEAVRDGLARLGDGGILCAQFGEVDFEGMPNRTARYLSTAREALHGLGIDDFARHVLVATTTGFMNLTTATILLRTTPFSDVEAERFAEHATRLSGGKLRHAFSRPAGDAPVDRIVRDDARTLASWYDAYPFDVRPVRDDAPFFWHFARFRDVLNGSSPLMVLNPEVGLGERLLLVLLGTVLVLGAAFLLVPVLIVRRTWWDMPYKWHAAAYFGALGVGFMLLEISLIQRLTLFLGYPTFSLTVTLFALLAATGVGSLASERYLRARTAAGALGVALTVLVLAFAYGAEPLFEHAFGWSLGARVAVCVALLAPLGFCLGGFMPLGLRTVAALTPHGQEVVAWSWAVNGFASVVGSVLTTILSMTIGFHAVMLGALAVYLIGIAMLLRIRPPAVGGA
jgi:spermidine synthase